MKKKKVKNPSPNRACIFPCTQLSLCIHRKLSFFDSLEIALRIQYSVNFILVLLYEHLIIEIEINDFFYFLIETNLFFCYLCISYDKL